MGSKHQEKLFDIMGQEVLSVIFPPTEKHRDRKYSDIFHVKLAVSHNSS